MYADVDSMDFNDRYGNCHLNSDNSVCRTKEHLCQSNNPNSSTTTTATALFNSILPTFRAMHTTIKNLTRAPNCQDTLGSFFVLRVFPSIFPAKSQLMAHHDFKFKGRRSQHASQMFNNGFAFKRPSSSTRVCSRRLKEALMKNISRKVQLGLVAIVTATAMLIPSSLAAAQNPSKPTIERWKICVTIKGVTICVGPGKVTPASVIID
jgi:hypothetical protein